jgi:hypothetical protein
LIAVFFISFLAIVFFSLGNSVLAVCYYSFERVMKSSMLNNGLKNRFSLVTAYYYLENDGIVRQKSFLECAKLIRAMTLGKSGSLEGDIIVFKFMDVNNNGVLSLPEFFRIGELVGLLIISMFQQLFISFYFIFLAFRSLPHVAISFDQGTVSDNPCFSSQNAISDASECTIARETADRLVSSMEEFYVASVPETILRVQIVRHASVRYPYVLACADQWNSSVHSVNPETRV